MSYRASAAAHASVRKSRGFQGNFELACRYLDRLGKRRTRGLHHPEERKRCKSQPFSVKLCDGELKSLALLQHGLFLGGVRLILQGRDQLAKCCKDSGFVGVVFVRGCHVKAAES